MPIPGLRRRRRRPRPYPLRRSHPLAPAHGRVEHDSGGGVSGRRRRRKRQSACPVGAAVLAARREGRPALLVVHGAGAGRYVGKRAVGVARELFQWTLGNVAARLSRPVSVSRVGVRGVRDLYGVEAAYLPYPVRDLPAASPPSLTAGEPFRVVWVGRLSPEKDPMLAVRAVELLREQRPTELAMYGDGPLRPRLDALARKRPWLEVLGARPWLEVQAAQGNAHACLSTSVQDNVQVALLEALSRRHPDGLDEGRRCGRVLPGLVARTLLRRRRSPPRSGRARGARAIARSSPRRVPGERDALAGSSRARGGRARRPRRVRANEADE